MNYDFSLLGFVPAFNCIGRKIKKEKVMLQFLLDNDFIRLLTAIIELVAAIVNLISIWIEKKNKK
ncbi:hypothetical protein FACS189446_4070 [Bacteroidia bacterium]|nr:hypothetical protein FACS189446_4070 [Bacteroidia bacterium]